MPDDAHALPDFVSWPTFPFEGELRVKNLEPLAVEEPPRQGDDPESCTTCGASDEEYIWVADRWRVRSLDRPSGLPMVLILESRSHLDLGDLPNLLAAELGVMVVRLERAIRSLEGVARVHVNRWGDGSAHLHLWFLARPYGRLQLRGTFLSMWDGILPPVPELEWRHNLALVAAWLGDFGGRAVVSPPRIAWRSLTDLADEGAAEREVLEKAAVEAATIETPATVLERAGTDEPAVLDGAESETKDRTAPTSAVRAVHDTEAGEPPPPVENEADGDVGAEPEPGSPKPAPETKPRNVRSHRRTRPTDG